MYYPEEVVEEVRMKNDIVDVISGYVHLQKKGANHFGLCPFHNEKSPSFSVSGSKQMFHCFGCGTGGNVFTFLMEYENCSFVEAVRLLADRAGVSLPEADDSEEARKREGRRARLLQVSREAAKYFYCCLRSGQGETGLRYLQGRRLSEETMKRFGLGFAPISGSQLVQYLHSRGYEDGLIREAGLAGFDERYGLHDKFWNRVMFPIQDINHRVIGFGGRVMGEARPKYLNSPETLIFDKGRNLYGLNFARTAKKGNIILCEGYMDVIAMHQAGFTQAVASLGTAFTEGQASLLKRYTEEVLLAYDSDEAGTRAGLRAIGILKGAGISCKVINMEPYKDPDEFISHLGTEAFQKRVEEAEGGFFFELRSMEREHDMRDPESKTAFYRRIAEKLCLFPEEIERENYLQAVAEKYGVSPKSLRELVAAQASRTGLVRPPTRPKSGIAEKNKRNTPEENKRRNQRLLFTWMTDEGGAYFPIIAKYISPEDFTDELYRQAAVRLFEKMKEGSFREADLVSMFSEGEEHREVAALLNERLEAVETIQEKEKALHDIILAVKKESWDYSCRKADQAEVMLRITEARKALEELSKTHISLKER
ncbi:MAG: DNA primase [Lachnospiraceae bacterium]|nr:DNA primase [Lachnospiraceae bacterium]